MGAHDLGAEPLDQVVDQRRLADTGFACNPQHAAFAAQCLGPSRLHPFQRCATADQAIGAQGWVDKFSGAAVATGFGGRAPAMKR